MRTPLGLECSADSALGQRVCHSIYEAIAASSVVQFAYTGLRVEFQVVAVEHDLTPAVSVAVATVAYDGDEPSSTFLDIQCLVYGADRIQEIGPDLVDRAVEQMGEALALELLRKE